MLKQEEKEKLIKDFRKNDKDTGSSAVQIAILSEKIKRLSEHLEKNKKDKHSRKGLLQMIAERRKHIKYFKKSDPETFLKVAQKLGIKVKG